MSDKQKGFTIVETILIFVIVGIIGFVGWFVWSGQKQINKTLDDSSKGSSSATSADEATTAKTSSDTSLVPISVEGEHATVYAPKNWKVTNGDTNDQSDLFATVKIISPDSKISVKFARLGGLGGYCDPTDGATITKLKVTPLVNTPSLSYVEYLQSDGKIYKMSVAPTSKATELQNGASVCGAYLDEVMENYKGHVGNAVFSISYEPFDKKLGDSISTAIPITAAEYDTFVSDADYITAKNILHSIKY